MRPIITKHILILLAYSLLPIFIVQLIPTITTFLWPVFVPLQFAFPLHVVILFGLGIKYFRQQQTREASQYFLTAFIILIIGFGVGTAPFRIGGLC